MNPTDREIIRVLHAHVEVSQHDIAARAGCSRRTVARALARMRRSGHIDAIGPGGQTPNRYIINYNSLPDSLRQELTR